MSEIKKKLADFRISCFVSNFKWAGKPFIVHAVRIKESERERERKTNVYGFSALDFEKFPFFLTKSIAYI